jgi:hypothetical protein
MALLRKASRTNAGRGDLQRQIQYRALLGLVGPGTQTFRDLFGAASRESRPSSIGGVFGSRRREAHLDAALHHEPRSVTLGCSGTRQGESLGTLNVGAVTPV